jgi:hypothetical protein
MSVECQEIDISIVKRQWFCKKHKVIVAGGKNCPLCVAIERDKKQIRKIKDKEWRNDWIKKNSDKMHKYERKHRLKYKDTLDWKKTRARIAKTFYEKLKADPERYKNHLRQCRKRNKKWVKNHPDYKQSEEFKLKSRKSSTEYYYKNREEINQKRRNKRKLINTSGTAEVKVASYA